jgi:hypothetical protein
MPLPRARCVEVEAGAGNQTADCRNQHRERDSPARNADGFVDDVVLKKIEQEMKADGGQPHTHPMISVST